MLDLFLFLALVIATEAATEIIVAAKITDSIRNKIRCKAHPLPPGDEPPPPLTKTRARWIFLDSLLSCGYCTSVWVAGGAALFAPWLIHWGANWFTIIIAWLVNWLIMLLLIHRFSNLYHVLFELIKKGRVKTLDIDVNMRRSIELKVRYGRFRQGSDEGGHEAEPSGSVQTSGSEEFSGH